MRPKRTSTLRALSRHASLCLGTLICLGCASAGAAEAEASPAALSDSRAIEEIEVTGQRSLGTLRSEILRDEERMFKQFNALNSRSDFDVHCGHRQITGSRIPIWECVPVYMKRAMAQNAQDYLQFGLLPKSEHELWWELRDRHAELDTELRALALQHPEFGQALLELHAKKQRLTDLEAEQRRGSGGFLSRLFRKDRD